jgi:cytochrome c-type biogenesis protein CcmH
MTQFWIFAAGLIALAMAFIVLPLVRKKYSTGISSDELNLSVFKQQMAELDSDLEAGILDQARYDAAKRDLEKELLSDVDGNQIKADTNSTTGGRWMAFSALAIPVVAVVLYQLLGSPQIIQRLANQTPSTAPSQAQSNTQAPNMEGMPPMDELVKRLAAKMEQTPDNQEGWIMLGRSYMAMKQFPEAMEAFERAMKLDDTNVGLLLAYGEAIAGISGNDFTGKAAPLIEKAFKLEPDNPNTLWMAGIVAYQLGDFQSALTRWEKLQGLLSPQSSELETINSAIDDVRKQLGMAPAEPELPQIAQKVKNGSENAAATTAGKKITVKVSLSSELSAKAGPNDVVFIYAKAANGQPMPLAAARKQVKDLPLTIELDDSMAMMAQNRLSAHQEVIVGARVSLSGNPSAKSGDLEGEVSPVVPGQSDPVEVVISSIHP